MDWPISVLAISLVISGTVIYLARFAAKIDDLETEVNQLRGDNLSLRRRQVAENAVLEALSEDNL